MRAPGRFLGVWIGFGLLAAGALRGEEHPQIQHFAFGGVGFAGTISEGETHYRKLLAGEDPLEAFQAWYTEGSLAAKAYSMTAFYRLDRDLYRREKDKLMQNPEQEVPVMRGCLVSANTWKGVFEWIESASTDYLDTPPARETESSK